MQENKTLSAFIHPTVSTIAFPDTYSLELARLVLEKANFDLFEAATKKGRLIYTPIKKKK